MKKTAFLAIAALLIAGCARESVPGGKEDLAPGTVLLKASFEAPGPQASPASKVDVSDAGAITWKAGDKIAVWTSNGSDGKFCEFSLYEGDGAASATFSGTPDAGYSVSTLAVYPAEAAKSYEGGTLTVTYPDAYDYGKGVENVRMAAYFDDAAAGLSFKHLGGMIRFTVTGIPADVNCFKLVSDKPP